MIEKKADKVKHEMKTPRDDGVELENQFILRLPEEVAQSLHEALQVGNLKDRITIKMDSDLRYGEVRFDQWLLHAKIVDLPTIIECLKTIDNKSFYKSADICQMMICKEEPDIVDPEKESPNKGKKRDPNKVDKKYLWPHGLTPPCKNVRKRRFRKTLKKKNVEAPEIEKEVKRLLRVDNDAVKVEYEIISEDINKRSPDHHLKDFNDGEDEYNDETMHGGEKTLNDSLSQKDINVESDNDDDARTSNAPISGVGEHDIFGEEVSSSSDDDEDDDRRESTRDLEDISRLSADDSRMSAFSVGGSGGGASMKNRPTNFNKSMFGSPKSDFNETSTKFEGSNSNAGPSTSYYDMSNDAPQQQLSSIQIMNKLEDLREEYNDLKDEQEQKAQEISSIQNPTLKQRMQEVMDNLMSQIVEKGLEIKDFENMLQEQS